MTARDTGTDFVLEQMILPASSRGGNGYQTQALVGLRPSGGKDVIDILAEKNAKRILISLKWQQISGTAEQKIPYEVICLAFSAYESKFDKAYLVLGGNGWSLRDFYVSGGLDGFLKLPAEVKIVKFEDFVAIANQGCLYFKATKRRGLYQILFQLWCKEKRILGNKIYN